MPSIPAQALYNACLDGDAAAVSRLLPLGGTPRNLSGPAFQNPEDKSTPLIAAAEGGHTEIVRMILERAPCTAVDHRLITIGATATGMAALFHHADIVRLLADRGANVNFAGQRRISPLCLAVGLISPDARPRGPDPDGARQVATVRALLRLGAGTLPPS